MSTYRTVRAARLYAARVVVLNAAARLSLKVFGLLDETDDLRVLTNAGGEFCPQMDQVFLKGCGNVRGEKRRKKEKSKRSYRIYRKKWKREECNRKERQKRVCNRGDQPQTHRTGADPEVLLLDVLDALINAFILQHLQGATEQH